MIEITKRQLADELGLSIATIESWQRDGLPHTRKGKANAYRLKDIITFLRERDGHTNIDPRREQGLLHRENRKMRKVQREQLEGQLVPVQEVTMMMTAHAAAARGKFLNLPTKLATSAISATGLEEIKDAATVLVHEALDEMSRTDITDYLPEEPPASTE